MIFCRLRNEKRKYSLKVEFFQNKIFLLILFHKPEFKSKIGIYRLFYEKYIGSNFTSTSYIFSLPVNKNNTYSFIA